MQGETIAYFVALLLIVIGAINWGYVAYTGNCADDIVNALVPSYARYVYALVGVAGIVLAALIWNKNMFGQASAAKAAVSKAIPMKRK